MARRESIGLAPVAERMIGRARRWLSRTAALSVLSALALPSPARAVPITYNLFVQGQPASGSLGGAPFSGADMFFSFDGDTDNVIAFSVPGVSGFENLKGAACVTVNSASVSFTTAFQRSAQVYVSVDSTNSGVGFGSAGVPPSDPTFPGQPVYPAAMVGGVSGYDLGSGGFAALGFPLSCVGFPGACQPGLPLPTGLGDLIIDPFGSTQAVFYAVTHDETPFASYRAEAERSGSSGVTVHGRFTLAPGSNGIDPVNDFTTIQIGCYQATISQFQANADGSFTWFGSLNDGTLRVRLTPRGGGRYAFRIQAVSPVVAGNVSPVLTVLTIGDDAGRATVRVER